MSTSEYPKLFDNNNNNNNNILQQHVTRSPFTVTHSFFYEVDQLLIVCPKCGG